MAITQVLGVIYPSLSDAAIATGRVVAPTANGKIGYSEAKTPVGVTMYATSAADEDVAVYGTGCIVDVIDSGAGVVFGTEVKSSATGTVLTAATDGSEAHLIAGTMMETLAASGTGKMKVR